MEKPAKSKPKPPPYPRPVPEIFAEELPPTPADIAWQAKERGKGWGELESEDDAEAQADKRAAKRRRIEAAARAYLRGEQLYIMSARLKGPFKPDWKNPWSKKKRVLKNGSTGISRSLEIAETTKRTSTRIEEDTTDKVVIAETEQQATSRASKIHSVERQVPEIRHPPSPFVDVATKASKSPIDPGARVPAKAKEKRVEEWLRRNESFAKKSEVQVLTSPTPASRTPETSKQSQVADLAFRTSQSEPIIRPDPLSGELVQAQSAGLNHIRRLSDVVEHVQKLSRDIQNVMNEPAALNSAALLDEVRRLANSTSKSGLESSRAEFAILRARQGLQQPPAPDIHLLASELESPQVEKSSRSGPALATDNLQIKSKEITHNIGTEESIEEFGASAPDTTKRLIPGFEANRSKADVGDEIQFSTAPQQRPDELLDPAHAPNKEFGMASGQHEDPSSDLFAAPFSISRPGLPTAVSEISTTDLLPSAQPRLEPQHSTSSVIKDDKLQSIKQIVSASEGTRDEANGDIKKNGCAPDKAASTKILEPSVPLDEQSEAAPSDVLGLSTDVDSNMITADMHEPLKGAEPPNGTNVKQPRGNEKNDLSNSVSKAKAKADKKRKKTSFAIDPSPASSHGSIQDVMKAKISKKLNSPPVLLLGKDNLDIEISDEEEEEESARKRSRRSNGVKPKSILKSTNPASPTTLRRPKRAFSTGQEQDVQNANGPPMNSGQNAVGEDNFDLDGAIDDLGSFLGTWDAEKEASGLNIEI